MLFYFEISHFSVLEFWGFGGAVHHTLTAGAWSRPPWFPLSNRSSGSTRLDQSAATDDSEWKFSFLSFGIHRGEILTHRLGKKTGIQVWKSISRLLKSWLRGFTEDRQAEPEPSLSPKSAPRRVAGVQLRETHRLSRLPNPQQGAERRRENGSNAANCGGKLPRV